MYEIFYDLCSKKGLTPYKVAKECGFSSVSLSDWKNKGTTPRVDKLIKIAKLLDTTVEYLVTGDDPQIQIETYSKEETEIIQMFRAIDNKSKNIVLNTLKSAYTEEMAEKKENSESLSNVG